MTHKSTALQIAGRTLRLVNVSDRLYVPMRFFVEETLDMNWGGQRKRLTVMAQRWKIADLLVAGQRKVTQQPCLPVGLLLPYLWLLRPGKPATIDLLDRLRDGWEAALLSYLHFSGSELANTGSFMTTEIERAMLPLIEDIGRLKKENAQLKTQLGEKAKPTVNVLSNPIGARGDQQTMEKETFLEMARLKTEGYSKAAIAQRLGCSRTTVSLFLDGKYQSGHAAFAWSELQSNPQYRACVTLHVTSAQLHERDAAGT